MEKKFGEFIVRKSGKYGCGTVEVLHSGCAVYHQISETRAPYAHEIAEDIRKKGAVGL